MDMREKLAPHFARWEFTLSDTATRFGLRNEPEPEHWESLYALATTVLEPAREALGPIRITSGYRAPAVNHAIGGSASSQHMRGEAADIVALRVPEFDLFAWIYDNVPFCEMIWEYGGRWVHVSYVAGLEPRRETLQSYRDRHGEVLYAPVTPEQIRCLST